MGMTTISDAKKRRLPLLKRSRPFFPLGISSVGPKAALDGLSLSAFKVISRNSWQECAASFHRFIGKVGVLDSHQTLTDTLPNQPKASDYPIFSEVSNDRLPRRFIIGTNRQALLLR